MTSDFLSPLQLLRLVYWLLLLCVAIAAAHYWRSNGDKARVRAWVLTTTLAGQLLLLIVLRLIQGTWL